MYSVTLCCRTLSQVWPATGTPVLATFISGLAAALAALLIQLEVLVEMMSIGKPVTHCFLVVVMTW
jgi:cationic amino acid transporter 14